MIEAAPVRLEEEGVRVNQGRRRRRRMQLAASRGVETHVRVGLLLDEAVNRRLDYMVELEHELAQAGHLAFHPPRAMSGLGQDTARVVAMVAGAEVDAWLVLAGSHEILEWFSAREEPGFAIFGQRSGLPLAGVGPDRPRAMAEVTRELVGLGHRRIVLLARPRRRLPVPGSTDRAFFHGLALHGITPLGYHLPDREESIHGFQTWLASLFRITPPTALIIDEASFFVAARQFL